MKPSPSKVIRFIFQVATNKSRFLFWLLIRFVSAIFPLIAIYQFSQIIKLIEVNAQPMAILRAIILIFVLRIVDNVLRLKSITNLETEIALITFEIHNFFLADLKTDTKESRHSAVQAIRNFTEASSATLNLVKQPGIDSLVSLLFIPAILYILDFRTCVLTIAYMTIYLFTDYYTTQRYAQLKDTLNSKTENYYATLQESNDFDLEQKTWTRHFVRVSNWAYTEWSLLQNISVIFYALILIYLVVFTLSGHQDLASVVLIMGYVSQTQVFLNSFSSIQDSLTDMLVGLERLANNQSVSALSLEDLI